jgi:hypothetical protein
MIHEIETERGFEKRMYICCFPLLISSHLLMLSCLVDAKARARARARASSSSGCVKRAQTHTRTRTYI